jgi:hypothetical protein
MPAKILPAALGVLLFFSSVRAFAAESLGDTLLAAKVPTQKFAEPELRQAITSYAISQGDPFLLAYYADDGSGRLHPPLHVIRYARKTEDLRRADLQDAKALVQANIPSGCFGSVLRVSEYRQTIYLEMHVGPSAGCVIVLSPALAVRSTLSGWLLGMLEPDYAILRRSEIHFKSVTALHVEVYDTKRNRTVEVYPPKQDRLRQQYSRLIAPHISDKWCMANNAECDPQDFDTDVMGGVAVNEAAKVFGFEAEFDAEGFGDAAKQQISPRSVVYVFRQRGGAWQSREFEPAQLQGRFGVSSIQDLVARKPNAAFEPVARK